MPHRSEVPIRRRLNKRSQLTAGGARSIVQTKPIRGSRAGADGTVRGTHPTNCRTNEANWGALSIVSNEANATEGPVVQTKPIGRWRDAASFRGCRPMPVVQTKPIREKVSSARFQVSSGEEPRGLGWLYKRTQSAGGETPIIPDGTVRGTHPTNAGPSAPNEANSTEGLVVPNEANLGRGEYKSLSQQELRRAVPSDGFTVRQPLWVSRGAGLRPDRRGRPGAWDRRRPGD